MSQGVRDTLLSEFSVLVISEGLDWLLEYSLMHACDDTMGVGGKVCDDKVGMVETG